MPERDPTRQELMDTISGLLGIPRFGVGVGSSLYSPFIDAMAMALGLDPGSLPNKYRRIEAILDALGQPYDPRLDSSEHRGALGGGTITNRPLAKIVVGLRAQADLRYFVASHRSTAAGAPQLAIRHGTPGLEALADAGARAQLLLAEPVKALGAMPLLTASASIELVAGESGGSFRATLAGYHVLPHAVPMDVDLIQGWTGPDAVYEITEQSYAHLLELGGGEAAPLIPSKISEPEVDPLSEVALGRPVLGSLQASPATESAIDEEKATAIGELPDGLAPRTAKTGRRRRGRLDKWAERRAVHIAVTYLQADGWELIRDRQLDGAGYDLEFRRGENSLFVEVKGIQSDRLAFNMTAGEWATAQVTPNYLVVAVTDVLSPAAFTVHAIGQAGLFTLRRRVVQYRLSAELARE